MLCLIGMSAIFSSTMAKNPALPLFAHDLGADSQTIGLIAAASTVVGVLASIPAGVLSDLYGRRRVILAATIVFASAPFLYLLVSTPWQLAAARVYHGFATAIFGPVAMALVADLFEKGRGQSMGWYSSATLIGRAAAPFVGGSILVFVAGSQLGFGQRLAGLSGYQWVYVVCGAAGVLALLLALRLPIDNRTQSGASMAARWQEAKLGLSQVVRNRAILLTSMMAALQYFSFGALEAFLPLYAVLAVQPRLDPVQIGTIFLAQVLTTALTKPVMGGISDKYGRRPVIALLVLFGTLYGLGLSIVTAATSAYVADLARASEYGSALGVLSTIMDVGHSTGPIAMGFLVYTVGFQWGFVAVAVLLGLAAVLFLAYRPKTNVVSVAR